MKETEKIINNTATVLKFGQMEPDKRGIFRREERRKWNAVFCR